MCKRGSLSAPCVLTRRDVSTGGGTRPLFIESGFRLQSANFCRGLQSRRFFRFRFGSSPSNPSSARLSASNSRPQTPPPRARVDEVRDREAGHLTSVSLPSLVEHTNKREEELMVELQAEREKYAKVVKEKSSLEQELEGLSQALFEEVFLVSIKMHKRTES